MPHCPQLESTNYDGSKRIGFQLNGPSDYRPSMIPFNVHVRPNSQAHELQRQPPQQPPQERYLQHGQPPSQHQQDKHSQLRARLKHQLNAVVAPHSHSKQPKPAAAATSAVTTLLSYCTADTPLNNNQVIAVTDVAGSMKELVLLALGAKDGDETCVHRLRCALDSEQALASIVDFFSGEFEVE